MAMTSHDHHHHHQRQPRPAACLPAAATAAVKAQVMEDTWMGSFPPSSAPQRVMMLSSVSWMKAQPPAARSTITVQPPSGTSSQRSEPLSRQLSPPRAATAAPAAPVGIAPTHL